MLLRDLNSECLYILRSCSSFSGLELYFQFSEIWNLKICKNNFTLKLIVFFKATPPRSKSKSVLSIWGSNVSNPDDKQKKISMLRQKHYCMLSNDRSFAIKILISMLLLINKPISKTWFDISKRHLCNHLNLTLMFWHAMSTEYVQLEFNIGDAQWPFPPDPIGKH